jgi:hypothetical protein
MTMRLNLLYASFEGELAMAVDYELLLQKYIAHVGEYEGIIFDPCKGAYATSVRWTDEELAAFKAAADRALTITRQDPIAWSPGPPRR